MKTFRLSALSLCVLFSVALLPALVAARIGQRADVSFTLDLDGDMDPPVVSVEALVSETREIPPWSDQPFVPAVFRISRTGTNGAMAVYFRLEGTASNGVDYDLFPDAIIQPGHESTEVYISAHDDELVEGTENVVLTLLPSPCLQCYSVGRPATATAYILDNDTTNTPPTVWISRPQEGATFTAPTNIFLRAVAHDREDGYDIAVEFFEGENKIGNATFVASLCPAVDCPSWDLTWPNVPPGRYTLTARATDSAGAVTVSPPVHVTVTGSNTPPEHTIINVIATDAQATEPGLNANPALTSGTFTFYRSGNLDTEIPVFFTLRGSASNGVDYIRITNRVVIPPLATQAVVNVIPRFDSLAEGTETVVLTLEPVGCIAIFPTPPECYLVGPSDQATVFIDDWPPPTNHPPFVQLNQPPDGAVFTAPATIPFQAYAQDTEDGYDLTVAFFEGTNRLGAGTFVATLCPAPYCPYFAFTWSNVPPGNYTLAARATDNAGRMTISAPVYVSVISTNPPPTNLTFIAMGLVWKYNDQCVDLGNEWRGFPYNDGPWASGPAQLGYGDGDEATVISAGPDPSIRCITAYFRRTFYVGNALNISRLTGRLLHDDGGVVYVNGIEVFRSNMPAGNVAFNTLAVAGAENQIVEFSVPPNLLLSGRNIVAVEMHQVNATSTDSSFDLELTGEVSPSNGPPHIVIVTPHEGDRFPAGSDIFLGANPSAEREIQRIDFYTGETLIGQGIGPLPSPIAAYGLAWSNPPVGMHTLFAVVTDANGLKGTSAPVQITIFGSNGTNGPPEVVIVTPHNGDTFRAGTGVWLGANVLTHDAGVQRVDFYRGSMLIGQAIGPLPGPSGGWGLSWSNPPVGDHVLRAVATDTSGLRGTSAPVSITLFGSGGTNFPIVRVLATDSNAMETADAAVNTGRFTFTRSGNLSNSLDVFFALSGTASNGVDYVLGTHVVAFPPGASETHFIVTPIDDSQSEPVETVVLQIFPPPPIGFAAPYWVGSPSNATVFIRDNDGPSNNVPPTVVLHSPSEGEVFAAPANILLRAAARDLEDRDGVRVEFFERTNRIGRGNFTVGFCPDFYCPTFNLTWSNVPSGSYTLTAKVTDSAGAMAVSAPVHITVTSVDPALTVTTTADSGPGSLRAIVASAPHGATIGFAVRGAITLTSGQIEVAKALNIQGPGANLLAVQRSSAPGMPEFRIFDVPASGVLISGLTIRGGRIGAQSDYEDGAGIHNRGSLVLSRCVVSDNDAVGEYSRGGGICNRGILLASQSTFAGNACSGFYGEGGAIYNYGMVSVTNCTFSGNSVGGWGGAIHNDGLSQGTTIESCTFTANSAASGGGIFNRGAPPWMISPVHLRNTIVVGNSGLDIGHSSVIESGGYNLIGSIGDPYGSLGLPFEPGPGDHTNVTASEVNLGQLRLNGGSTPTHALLRPSLAIDAGPATDFPLTDQRGVSRPFGPRSDIGAFELDSDNSTEASLAITKPADGTNLRAGETIFIEAIAIDLEGYISRVEFWDGEQQIGVSEVFFIQPPEPGTPIYHSFEWHGAATGSHVLTARAARADGTAVQSQRVNMYVGVARPDGDRDGVPDETDLCPNTSPNVVVDERGCSAAQRDADGDGVPDDRDQCPGTPFGVPVDADGCPLRSTNCPPRVAWERSFGGSGYEYISQVQQTADGGYILGGSSLSGAGGNKTSVSFGKYDIWIVRLDVQGNKLWERSFGGSGDDGLSSIALTADGGFIIGGLSDSGPGGNKTSPNYGTFDLWLLRLDGQGNKLWEKSFGGSRWDSGGATVLTADGGFIVAATSESPADGNKTSPNLGRTGTSDLWVLRLNASGEKLWERTFGGEERDSGAAVQQTTDGGFVLAGQTSSGTGGNYEGWVVRLDADGNKLWDRTYGGTALEGFGTLGKTDDGGFVLGGWTTSGPGGNKTSPNFGALDSWIVRVDASGVLLWEQTFGGIDEERLVTLRLTPDGGIVFGSSSQSPLSGNRTTVHLGQRDWWIVRLAADGSEVWQRTVGGSSDDEFRDVLPMADGGYLLAGNSDSTDGDRHSPDFGGYGDFWVVRLLPESTPHCDRDADGVPDSRDQCPNTPVGAVVNADGCSIAEVAPCDGPWRSHRHRVNAVRRAAFNFHQAGLITRRARQEIIRDAVRSDCGWPRPRLSMPLQCADEIRTNGCRLILASDGPVTCIVESSVDLIHWKPISTNRLSGVAVRVNDPDAWAAPRRFYRARLP